MMKKCMAFVLVIALLCAAAIALAESGLVVAINATVNGESSVTIDDASTLTAIATLEDGEYVDHWELNGQVVENENKQWLVFTADGNTVIMAVKGKAEETAAPEVTPLPVEDPAPAPTAEAVLAAAPATEQKTVTAIGCTLQYLNSKSKGEGPTYDSITFTDTAAFEVTATVPKGKKISYWVIDGIRYDFETAVKSIVVEELQDSMTLEVVLGKADPTTQWETGMESGEAPLTVSVINGELKFMKSASKSGGNPFTTFDFTNDYVNTATKKTEAGGQVTVKVKATIPSGKEVTGWKFNDVKMTFSPHVGYFFAKSIHQTMEYEPIFGVKYVTVSCTNCTFTGGGYTNAKSGTVKAGTKITVTSIYSHVHDYKINGSYGHSGQKSFSTTINVNTKIESYSVIN